MRTKRIRQREAFRLNTQLLNALDELAYWHKVAWEAPDEIITSIDVTDPAYFTECERRLIQLPPHEWADRWEAACRALGAPDDTIERYAGMHVPLD